MSPTTQQQPLKLTYFDGTGRAELARLLFTIGNVEFVDERVERADFPALKPTLPLGQLPVLQVNGNTYSQGMAIARYAAKVSGLYPQDPVDALRAEMVSETVLDLMNAFVAVMFAEMDDASRAEKSKVFVGETAPKFLKALEDMVQGEVFFLGDKDAMCYADVHVFDCVRNGLKEFFPSLSTAAFPKLETLMTEIETNACVAAFLAKHQKK